MVLSTKVDPIISNMRQVSRTEAIINANLKDFVATEFRYHMLMMRYLLEVQEKLDMSGLEIVKACTSEPIILKYGSKVVVIQPKYNMEGSRVSITHFCIDDTEVSIDNAYDSLYGYLSGIKNLVNELL